MTVVKNLKRWWRDLWRGYTDDDLYSIQLKMSAVYDPGELVIVNAKELRALNDLQSDQLA